MKKTLSNLLFKQTRKFVKQKIVKVVSLDDEFPDLEKSSLVYPETIATPEAETMPFLDEVKHLQGKTYSTPLGYTALLKDVLYCPEYNIILTRDRKIISDSFIPYTPAEEFKITWLFRKNIEVIPGYCTLLDQLANHYYHKIIDNIPRFYLACQHDLIKSQQKLVHLLHTTDISNDFFLSKLIPSNVLPIQLSKGKLYRIENLIFASFLTRHLNGSLPTAFRENIYSQFLPRRTRIKKNRIFISRAKAPLGRHVSNEDKFLEMLGEIGFKRYLLEDLTVSEQIELFYDAEAVIAPHGAGLTNLLFSEQVKVLELFQRRSITPTYYYLSKSMGHQYHYWCSPNEKASHFSNFEVNVAEIEKIVKNFLTV